MRQSPGEIAQILAAARSLEHRAILMTACGAGLRVGEICALRVSDIDSEHMLIHVHDGKGGKDRYVMLSPRLLMVLRDTGACRRRTGCSTAPGSSHARPAHDGSSSRSAAGRRRSIARGTTSPGRTEHHLPVHHALRCTSRTTSK